MRKRTLFEIIDLVKDGKEATYNDLCYAVCALTALNTFDGMAIDKLAEGEREDKPKILSWSAVFQQEERFNRHKAALSKNPKDWIGWNNDPNNPDYIKRRKAAIKLAEKFAEPADRD